MGIVDGLSYVLLAGGVSWVRIGAGRLGNDEMLVDATKVTSRVKC